VNDALVEHVRALLLMFVLQQLHVASQVDHNRTHACKEIDPVIQARWVVKDVAELNKKQLQGLELMAS
jgi:hypothetical protein